MVQTRLCHLKVHAYIYIYIWRVAWSVKAAEKAESEKRRNVLSQLTCSTQPISSTQADSKSYVYWTVHHLDSWIKRNQLDVTCFFVSLFDAQHVSDVNTSILRSLRLIWWVISWVVLFWFDACWCYVVVRYPDAGWSTGASGYHTTPAKPQRNTNTYRTRAIQPMK